jgi:hypothetical protein
MKLLATPSTRPRFSRSRVGEPVVDVVGLEKRASSLPWSELKGVGEDLQSLKRRINQQTRDDPSGQRVLDDDLG